jgi:translocation and assembly module TamB
VQVAGSQIPPGDWQGQGSGDRGGLQLQRLHGALLDGEVSLSGFLGWDPVATWTLQVAGDGLDPGQWLPAIPGRLTLALRSAGRIDPDQGIQGGIELEQLVGNLADRDLDLSASASLAGEIFTVEALRLNSDGNRFTARGQLSPALALEWELQAPSPGALLPGLDGRLAARGRLAGSPAQPRLQARLSGEDLLLETRSLPRLTAELEVGPALRGRAAAAAIGSRTGPRSDLEPLAGTGPADHYRPAERPPGGWPGSGTRGMEWASREAGHREWRLRRMAAG